MNVSEFQNIAVGGNIVCDTLITLEDGKYDGNGAELTASGGIIIVGDNVTLENLTVRGSINVSGKNAIIYNCKIISEENAIVSNADGLIIKKCEITCNGASVSLNGSHNCLIAQSNMSGDVLLCGVYNCAVVLNRARSLDCNGGNNVYIIENTLSRMLTVCNNDHIICDENKYQDLASHSNRNFNGSSITATEHRLDVGADEDLLPHTDKDLFVGMERQCFVRDASLDEELGINEYIGKAASSSSLVIVPPGAYSADTTISLGREHSNTVVYAYGVYEEAHDYGNLLRLNNIENLTVKGLSMGYDFQSSGQVFVLEKLGDLKVRVVTAAGYVNGFGKADPDMFSRSFMDLYRPKTPYNWSLDYYQTVEHNDDGTMTLTFKDPSVYDRTEPGDAFSCRLAKHNYQSVYFNSVNHVLLKDCVLYGYSAGLAVTGEGPSSDVWLDRFHDTVHSGALIDEETYSYYESLEKKYNVSLEIYRDELGRPRGSIPRVGSCDATHLFGTRQGLNARSCLFESMCDDGSNQRSNSARLHSLINNGDGTATLRYKSNLSHWYYTYEKATRGYCNMPFSAGDRIYVYTPDGRTVCDTVTLTESKALDDIEFTLTYDGEERKCFARVIEVQVRAADVDFEAIEPYDLSDNRYEMTNKIIVDNLSRNSADFVFDNVCIRYTRSRAMLVKTLGATIKNCTFDRMACTALLLAVEPTWGESTVARDVNIKSCLFRHHGYHNDDQYENKDFAAIAVRNFSSRLEKNALPGKNITVDGCRFESTYHHYAIAIRAAQDIHIINNTFEPIINETDDNIGKAIDLETVMDVEISNNRFTSSRINSVTDTIRAANVKHVFGSDVTDSDGNSLIADAMTE